MNIKIILSSVLVLVVSGCGLFTKTSSDNSDRDIAALNRPPQFVLLSFDGSKDSGFWQSTMELARDIDANFTYFISGVYFIHGKETSTYQAPGKKAGRSDIGFGRSVPDIQQRLRHIEEAISEGHEIAAHANGHFDGSSWSEEDWRFEFVQFDHFLASAYERVGLKEPKWWNRYFSQFMVGFRAPLLATSSGMYKAMGDYPMKYDASQVGKPYHWPKYQNGIWNFPLAKIQRHGTGKTTLSMDYNFYFAHSNGEDGDSKEFKNWEDEMYKSYLAYFKNNYSGNRAPVHIGHHFNLWNGGAYYKAFRRFAKDVCKLPEVRCVTYRELLEYMEKNKNKIAKFQAGQFQRASVEDLSAYLPPEATSISFTDPDQLDDSEVNAFMKHLRSESSKPHED